MRKRRRGLFDNHLYIYRVWGPPSPLTTLVGRIIVGILFGDRMGRKIWMIYNHVFILQLTCLSSSLLLTKIYFLSPLFNPVRFIWRRRRKYFAKLASIDTILFPSYSCSLWLGLDQLPALAHGSEEFQGMYLLMKVMSVRGNVAQQYILNSYWILVP